MTNRHSSRRPSAGPAARRTRQMALCRRTPSGRFGAEPWSVEICGLVDRPMHLSLDDLRRLPLVEAQVDIHCVTRWSKLGLRFGGATLRSLLDLAGCQPDGPIRFVRRSQPARAQHVASTRRGTAVGHAHRRDGRRPAAAERARRAGPRRRSRPLLLQEPQMAGSESSCWPKTAWAIGKR